MQQEPNKELLQEETPLKETAFVLESSEDFLFAGESPAEESDRKKAAKKGARKKRKHSSVGGGLLYICFVLIVCVVLALGSFLVVRDALAIMKPTSNIELEVEIPMGSTTEEIANILAENHVIDYPFFFRAYMKFFGEGAVLQYGSFNLHPGMSYEEVKLKLQEVSYRETVTVTIPEGYDLLQIAQLLKQKGVIENSDDFIDYTNSHLTDLVPEKYQSLVGVDAARFFQVEGFLFPDTYEFYTESSNASAAKKLVNRFFEIVDENLETIQAGMDKTGLSFVKYIALASVIQKECSVIEEMPQVAGVFRNRLAAPLSYPRLESDPTRDYANEVVAQLSLVPVQKMIDSYNTYVCTGPPAGPICSPGKDAILAAANAAEHEYYFFVTDSDGKFYYSKTYAEHQRICWELGYYGA